MTVPMLKKALGDRSQKKSEKKAELKACLLKYCDEYEGGSGGLARGAEGGAGAADQRADKNGSDCEVDPSALDCVADLSASDHGADPSVSEHAAGELLSDDIIGSMTCQQLRAELRARKVSATGRKGKLVERLKLTRQLPAHSSRATEPESVEDYNIDDVMEETMEVWYGPNDH